MPRSDRNLSPKAFAISMTMVLIAGLAVLAGVYFIVNPPMLKSYGRDGMPVTLAPVSFTLTISSPEDNLLVFDSNLLVQGKSSPSTTVIISSELLDQTTEADVKGSFSATIKLQPGVNQLIIAAFDNTGNSKTEQRTIYYSKEKI